MKLANILLILIIFNMPLSVLAQKIQIPGAYQWKNRILLLFSPAQGDQYQQQLKTWQAENAGMKDRDLVIFHIVNNTVSTPEGDQSQEAKRLRDKFEVDARQFTVILLGKDGGQKLKQEEILTTEKLFAIIDAMPMRRREMRENDG